MSFGTHTNYGASPLTSTIEILSLSSVNERKREGSVWLMPGALAPQRARRIVVA